MKKYEVVKPAVLIEGITLFRIRALRDFSNVKAGTIGGYVASERNLSQDGLCWINEDAMVYDNAVVYGDAVVAGDTKIYNEAQVFEYACVTGNATVYDMAAVCGSAQVYDNAKIFGDAMIRGNATIYGNATVFNRAMICGEARVYGNAKVKGYGEVAGAAHVSGYARVTKTCITVNSRWPVTITDRHLQISCEVHLITDWFSFTDDQIAAMHPSALQWWQQNKVWVQQLCLTKGG